MRIVVDSYAWIEFLMGSHKGGIVKERLGEAEEVYTPDIVLAELARKYLRENFDNRVVEERLARISELSKVTPISIEVALKAAELDIELREGAKKIRIREPSLLDAIVLATARVLDASLITGDEHLKGRPEVIWIGG